MISSKLDHLQRPCWYWGLVLEHLLGDRVQLLTGGLRVLFQRVLKKKTLRIMLNFPFRLIQSHESFFYEEIINLIVMRKDASCRFEYYYYCYSVITVSN